MIWLALLYKELQQSSARFFISLGLISAAYLLMFWLVHYELTLIFLLAAAIVFFHVFYLFIAWLAAFSQEWRNKTQLFWLNLPSGAVRLLSAKMAAGLIQLMVSLAYAMVLAFFLIRRIAAQNISGSPELAATVSDGLTIVQTVYLESAPLIYVSVVYGALHLGFAAVFIFLVSKVIRPFGWLAGIAVTILAQAGLSSLRSTPFYETMTEWGQIFRIDGVWERIAANINGYNQAAAVETGEVLYIGEVLAASGWFLLLFALFVYLFNHRVQA
ncbi:hypothetical protein [Salisediminibacterium halotolerans]|uniref:ABC-2 family transporter protein n=1 Tax=Salisediminibacterium halotolerans TaxID=517425 RepID=A0A1H9RV92_9BACI|nr:hypothetical protein [Salisediminibacterium haloalkalitolerans]SER76498.1 hypothetical protein SAMN05444126_105107 [Salisediminibacterium haloalkalitolerans]